MDECPECGGTPDTNSQFCSHQCFLLAAERQQRGRGPLKAPQFAAITIALDTGKYRLRRPEERADSIHYLIDRLLSGDEVAKDALEHYGLRVSIREAVKPEMI